MQRVDLDGMDINVPGGYAPPFFFFSTTQFGEIADDSRSQAE